MFLSPTLRAEGGMALVRLSLIVVSLFAFADVHAQRVKTIVMQSTGVYGYVQCNSGAKGDTGVVTAVQGLWNKSADSSFCVLELHGTYAAQASVPARRYLKYKAGWHLMKPDPDAGLLIQLRETNDSLMIRMPGKRRTYSYQLRKSSP